MLLPAFSIYKLLTSLNNLFVDSSSTSSRPSRELIPIYRMLQVVSYRALKLFRDWLVAIVGSTLAVIILTGFCLVECFQECGIFLTGFAIIVFCLTSSVLCDGLRLAGEIPTLCDTFVRSVCTSEKFKLKKLEKRVMKSCAPIELQFGSFLVVNKDSCVVWLDFIFNRIIDLVVTY